MKESEEWEEALGSPSKPGLSSDEYGCVDVLMVMGRKLDRRRQPVGPQAEGTV